MQPKFLSDTSLTYNGIPTYVYADAIILKPSISSAEGFHAKISATLESERESTESEADYGASSTESFANYDLNTSSWRTSQLSLFGGLTEFLGTWPRAGMMRNGNAYQRHILAQGISEIGCGLLPTPARTDSKGRFTLKTVLDRASKLTIGVRLSEHTARLTGKVGRPNPRFWEKMMMFPIGWTELNASEMPLSLKSPNGSENE